MAGSSVTMGKSLGGTMEVGDLVIFLNEGDMEYIEDCSIVTDQLLERVVIAQSKMNGWVNNPELISAHECRVEGNRVIGTVRYRQHSEEVEVIIQ
jgi:hypothetical protein